jgi:uncharacterized damage-inducible protein DinB
MSVFSNPISAAGDEAEAYIAAVLALLGDRDPALVLQATPDQLHRSLAGRSPKELQRPERPGKWSALEVLQHLADSDLVWAYRMRLVVAEDRPTLTGYDQDRWASQLRYGAVAPDQALEQFEVLRKLNLRLLAELPQQAFERVGIHSERGEERLDHMVRLYAGHDLVHLRQLARILDAVGGV